MAGNKQNPTMVAALALAIVISLAFAIKAVLPKRPPPPLVDWTCEKCEHKFLRQSQTKPVACPKCGGEAVWTAYFHCSVHDEIFEAYRLKRNPKLLQTPEKGGKRILAESMVVYKTPGGEWSPKLPKPIICPQGNSDQATLERCPPTSEIRSKKR